jgi:hypothetical protein
MPAWVFAVYIHGDSDPCGIFATRDEAKAFADTIKYLTAIRRERRDQCDQ